MKVHVAGLEPFRKFIQELPRGMKIAAMRGIASYLAERPGAALQKEPDTKFVRRADAYGKVSDAPAGYFSWPQFRFVAALTEGFTKFYQRTHEMSKAWEVKESNSDWSRVVIENSAPGAIWAYADNQARQLHEVGWHPASQMVSDNMAGAMRAGQEEVDKLIAQKNGE